jgi:hypothetical protein
VQVRRALALGIAALLAGCGAPQEPAKQAEELHSIAAEGALLAHEAAEGSYATFTSEHAAALRGLLAQLRPALEDPGLERRAAEVDASLAQLARDPGDQARAASVERRLEALAR